MWEVRIWDDDVEYENGLIYPVWDFLEKSRALEMTKEEIRRCDDVCAFATVFNLEKQRTYVIYTSEPDAVVVHEKEISGSSDIFNKHFRLWENAKNI